MRLYMLADELHDVIHRSAGLKDCRHADFLEAFDVLIGDNAADQHQHVIHFILLEQVHNARHDRVVRTRENRESDDLNIFLERGIDDHLWRLPQTGVDDLHASIAQRPGDYLRAAVMTVKAGLRY